MTAEDQALIDAFQKVVEILDAVPAEARERVVRAAMILVGSPISAGEKHG